MKKLVKKAITEKENMVALATQNCYCGCGCTVTCSCAPIPTHQIAQTQSSSGHTTSQARQSGSVSCTG